METINHESYISLETAQLLKQAGFDWKVSAHYSQATDEIFAVNPPPYPAPTLEVAQRWLREVKNISIEVKTRRWVNRYQDGKYTVSYTHELWPIDMSIVPNNEDKFIRYTIDCACNIEFQTYEEALEAGIKNALEIILEKGE